MESSAAVAGAYKPQQEAPLPGMDDPKELIAAVAGGYKPQGRRRPLQGCPAPRASTPCGSATDNLWCAGWQASSRETSFLLGDILLSNKLVVYDLEKQVIGWTDYNCSGSIKVQDDKSGAVYTVDAHSVSSADIVKTGGSIILFLITAAFYMVLGASKSKMTSLEQSTLSTLTVFRLPT